MSVVDTHCHASNGWLELIKTLVHQMDSHGAKRSASNNEASTTIPICTDEQSAVQGRTSERVPVI